MQELPLAYSMIMMEKKRKRSRFCHLGEQITRHSVIQIGFAELYLF